jgi:hypothetical protein
MLNCVGFRFGKERRNATFAERKATKLGMIMSDLPTTEPQPLDE